MQVEAEKNHNMDDKGKREKRKHKRERHHKVKNEKNSDSENTSESEDDRKKRKHSKRRHSSRDNSKVEERRKNDCLASERHKDGDSQHPNRSSGIFSNSGYPRESEQDMRNNSKKKLEDKEERSNRLASDRLIGRHSKHEKRLSRIRPDSRYPSESEEDGRNHNKRKHSSKDNSEDDEERRDSYHRKDIHAKHENHSSRIGPNSTYKERRKHVPSEKSKEVPTQNEQGPGCNHRKSVPKMTEEEREARLREMQMDAELHEEQRWKRITNAAEADAREAARATNSGGKNFLDAAQKSLYGTEKGGRSTIEESVRRRAYYSQGGSAAHESNAFRR